MKKRLMTLFLAVAVLLPCMTLAGCGGGNIKDYVGKWQVDSWNDNSSWQIYDDNTAIFTNGIGVSKTLKLVWSSKYKSYSYTDEYEDIVILKLNKDKNEFLEHCDPDGNHSDILGKYKKVSSTPGEKPTK